MLTPEQNNLLTQVGPGTPGGNFMRRYWHPIAATSEMADRWTMKVRLLGEDLVLYRNRQGEFGLITEKCPHRGASLAYGIPTNEGIRCPYHGWEFAHNGKCLDQPNEPQQASFKDKIQTPAYRIEELNGLLFAYMGPEPIPLLPKWDAYMVEGAIRMLGRTILPCNYLQIMENSLDPVHTEWLHGNSFEFLKEKEGIKVAISTRHEKIAFREFEYGMTKHRLLVGQSEDSDDWQIGHPIVFPNILSVGNGSENSRYYSFQVRVPVDDTHTLHLWYTAYVPPEGAKVPNHLLDRVHTYEVPQRDENGEFIMDNIDGQDIMVWITQGPVSDRAKENLGSTDQGVAIFRRLLRREIKKVEEGKDPIGVIRNPEVNSFIELPNERTKHQNTDGFGTFAMRTHAAYSPIIQEVIDIFEPYQQRQSVKLVKA
jgi:5,5'-dehydrodivanillate O-demethylase oxygenase subunit